MTQDQKDAREEQRRRLEHEIMSAANIRLCPNIAHKEYVHLPTCDAIHEVLRRHRPTKRRKYAR